MPATMFDSIYSFDDTCFIVKESNVTFQGLGVIENVDAIAKLYIAICVTYLVFAYIINTIRNKPNQEVTYTGKKRKRMFIDENFEDAIIRRRESLRSFKKLKQKS